MRGSTINGPHVMPCLVVDLHIVVHEYEASAHKR